MAFGKGKQRKIASETPEASEEEQAIHSAEPEEPQIEE